jgi:hypothetical protein
MFTVSLRWLTIVVLLVVLGFVSPAAAQTDEVLEWNAVFQRAIVTAGPAVPGPVQGRLAAIVHVAIFDALNGIDRRFTPIHVTDDAPPGASREAAIAKAAYTALAGLFPAQIAAFDADLEASLARIASDSALEHSQSIARGLEWGEHVANEILAWRNADGLTNPTPTYNGSTVVGKWRPTPRPNPMGGELPGLPGLVPQMATTDPFVIPSPSSFRPQNGPPPLSSVEYATDVNEVKLVGENTSAARTADQTQAALFWASTALTFWNRAAATASRDRHLTLFENARLFALLNVSIADALIACWDSKYFFELWRPITAIRLATSAGNAAIIEQATWTPLIVTPAYPEYYSGHQSVSGSAAAILTAYFGSEMPVEGFSEGLPNVTRSWSNFAEAADEAFMARIWSGIHFRFAMRDTRLVANQIVAYILENAAQPVHGKKNGQTK